MADDTDAGRDAGRGLVHRREVVQVQHVGLGCTGRVERGRPRFDLALVLAIVERGNDPVRGAAAVLVGRVHRGRPHRGIERIGRYQGRVERHGSNVDAGKEARRVTEVAEVGPRAGDQGHVPAVYRELERQGARDV
jgi:hypothetical protein